MTSDELAETRQKLDKIRKRAARKGFPQDIDLHAEPYEWSERTPDGGSIDRRGWKVTITGEPPAYNGWRFIAAANQTQAGAVLRYAPGAQDRDDIDHSRFNTAGCDHCGTVRRRTSTAIVENIETGELKQVGRSCVEDFLGHDIWPVWHDDLADDLGLGGHDGPGRHWDAPVVDVVAHAWACVKVRGYVSRRQAEWSRHESTSLSVLTNLGYYRPGHDADPDPALDLVQEGRRRAPGIIAEVAAHLGTENSAFAQNLSTVLACEWIDVKQVPLACSTIAVHRRIHEQNEKRKAQAARTSSEWVGQLGQKLTTDATIKTALELDSYTGYGTGPMLIVAHTDTGSALKMITAAAWAYQVKPGDQIKVAATVKEHGHYRDLKQTTLVRPKLLAHNWPADPDAQTVQLAGTITRCSEHSPGRWTLHLNLDTWALDGQPQSGNLAQATLQVVDLLDNHHLHQVAEGAHIECEADLVSIETHRDVWDMPAFTQLALAHPANMQIDTAVVAEPPSLAAHPTICAPPANPPHNTPIAV